jgi:hypothetical protein
MSNVARKAKAKPAVATAAFGPHPDDAEHVRRAFEEHAKREGRGLLVVTPEELRRWAETGEWPESSG